MWDRRGNGGDSFQTAEIGYGYENSSILGPIGAPKNIAEEYRCNIPVLYYAYNANF